VPESHAKPKILVADDEPVIADTLAIILTQAGYEATAVYGGKQAVEVSAWFCPDILVSDVIMSDLNGIDAAVAIHNHQPTCKVVLISGQAATGDLLDTARADGHNFEILAKPVHPRDLLALIGKMLPASFA
jgi:CheY-like chemotaxis protein